MKKLACVFVLSLVCLLMFAQADHIDKKYLGEAVVKCPTVVEQNKLFIYSVSIPDKRDSIAMPLLQLEDFCGDIEGPGASAIHKLSCVNGKTLVADTIRYVWTLVAREAKEYSFPSFRIMNKSNTAYYEVPEVKIDVKTSLPKNQANSVQNTSMVKDSVYVEWIVSTEQANVGDTIKCTCLLYSTWHVTQLQINDNILENDNCFIKRCKLPRGSYSTRLKSDSIKWICRECAEYIITPYEAGQLTLGGGKYTAILRQTFNGEDFYKRVKKEFAFPKKSITILDNKEKNEQEVVENTRNNIYVLMDISSSTKRMLDFSPNRLSAEKTLAKGIINAVPNVGFLSFDAEPEYFASHGSGKTSLDILNYIDSETGSLNDRTSVSDALLYPLLKTKDVRSLIVLCDGLDNTAHVSMNTALNILEKSGVQVNMVYFNSYKDSCYYERSNLGLLVNERVNERVKNNIIDEDILNNLTQKIKNTGGDLYIVKQDEDIHSILPSILQSVQNNPPRKKSSKGMMPTGLMDKLRRTLCP